MRALLIQKDVKLINFTRFVFSGLRALLIQKDVKPGQGRFIPRIV